MPQSSIDVVRGHIDAFRAQETERALSFLDPHVVWDGSRTAALEAGETIHGSAALAEFVRRYRGTFEGYDYELAKLADLGSGAVLAAVTETGSGRTSGVPVTRSIAVLYTVIEDKIARITVFPTEQAARAAAAQSGEVELVSQLVDAVARQDLPRLLELTDPSVQWQSVFAQLREGGVYRGHEGIRQYMADLAETAEVLQAAVDDVLIVGARILAVGRLTYRGKGSGVETETAVGYFIRVRDGRALELRAFRDPEEAIAASLGLSSAV